MQGQLAYRRACESSTSSKNRAEPQTEIAISDQFRFSEEQAAGNFLNCLLIILYFIVNVPCGTDSKVSVYIKYCSFLCVTIM